MFTLLAAVPSSSNFTLQAYDFGNGGGASNSSNYQLGTQVGSAGDALASGSYTLPAGIVASSDASTPPAPTFINENNSYNSLKVTLNNSGFASDVRYLIAVSDNNFATSQYVKPDQTLGTNAGIANYQTYATWGGASGFSVLGLQANTTYKARVAAWQGGGTGSAFGPSATAATVQPSLTFAVATSLTSTPPFNVDFSSLPAGQVTTANATITATLTTNAAHGGNLIMRGQNGGLASASSGFTITSATADLTAANSGYGAQIANVLQTGGGPLTALSPFNGVSANVGTITASWQPLASFPNPIVDGAATLTLKAKSHAAVPAAADYQDTLTISASLLF